jgi:hypothetical protein
MSPPPGRISRRAFVQALGCSGIAVAFQAQPALRYSVAVRRVEALLGDPIRAVLTCAASSSPVEGYTFQDGSLELDLVRMPAAREPVRVFPNRVTIQQGTLQIRTQPLSRQRIQRLSREVDLIALYPRWLLDTGAFRFSYRLGPDNHPSAAGPANLTIDSGPGAVAGLFTLLDHADAGVRARASGLLHRMTAHIAGYGSDATAEERQAAIAQWRLWWQTEGDKLAWNFLSQGATFGGAAAPPPRSRKSRFLGGCAYARGLLAQASAAAVAAALSDWLRNPSGGPESLRGVRCVGDREIAYPPESEMVEPGEELAKLLSSALVQIPSRPAAADVLLATVARMPDARFIEPLSTVEHSARQFSALRQAGYLASGLLDLLDPDRTPTGDA